MPFVQLPPGVRTVRGGKVGAEKGNRASGGNSEDLMSSAARPLPVSCILDASAGTGKTTQLVRRIVSTMTSGVRPENIVAVTFTNAAAGEMKLRVRQKLEEELQSASEEVREHLQIALRELERA